MGIIDDAKKITELIQQYGNQELYERLIDLRGEIIILGEENISLKQELGQLKKEREIEEELVLYQDKYYRKTDTERQQLFCMTCWDADRKLVTVYALGDDIFTCRICSKR